jgi:hypothetical protein
LPGIVRVIKLRMVHYVGRAYSMDELGKCTKISFAEHHGKRPFGHEDNMRWDNIKITVRDLCNEDVNWTEKTRYRI